MQDHLVSETVEGRNGLTLKVCYDEYAESPREDTDCNYGFFITTDNRYFSLQEGDYSLDDIKMMLEYQADKKAFADPYEHNNRDKAKQMLSEIPVVLPVYMYAHSGVSINTGGFSCPWDSGQIGYYYTTRKAIARIRGHEKRLPSRKKLESWMKHEIEVMDNYLRGYSSMYVIEDSDGDCVDSCSGYNTPEEALEQGKEALKWKEEELDEMEKSNYEI